MLSRRIVHLMHKDTFLTQIIYVRGIYENISYGPADWIRHSPGSVGKSKIHDLLQMPLNLGSFREYVLIMKMLFRLIFTWNHTYYLTTRTYHLVVTTYYIYGGHQFKIIYFVLLS